MLAGGMQRLDHRRPGAEALLELLHVRAGREVDLNQRLERIAKRLLIQDRAIAGYDTALLEPPQAVTSRARAKMHPLGELLQSHATACGHGCEDYAVNIVHRRAFDGRSDHWGSKSVALTAKTTRSFRS